jgi:putative transposase
MPVIESYRAYKYRLYTSKKDKHLHRLITIAGNVHNHIVALQRRYYRLFGGYVSLGRMKTHLKNLRNGRNYWWRALSAQSIQEIAERVDGGYQKFFENIKKGKPRKVGAPKFKKPRKYSSFTLKTSGWRKNAASRFFRLTNGSRHQKRVLNVVKRKTHSVCMSVFLCANTAVTR